MEAHGCGGIVFCDVGSDGGAGGQGQAKPAPMPEEAKKFIEEAEQRLFDLNNRASRASWVQENSSPTIRSRSRRMRTRY